MPPASAQPKRCQDCCFAKAHYKKRQTGGQAWATYCYLAGRPTQATRTACSLAKPKLTVQCAAVSPPGP